MTALVSGARVRPLSLALLPLALAASCLVAGCGGGSAADDDAAMQADDAEGKALAQAAKVSSVDLFDARKKEIAMELVSSAENSSLDWKAQYTYIEDIGDGRGYTGGIIGFCSGTGDMLEVVQDYANREPGNGLARYLPALRKVNGTDSHSGLGSAYVSAWHKAASDTVFQQAQDAERDSTYFNPAVN